MIKDQREFAQSLVFTAEYWLGPMPADLPHMDRLSERLDGLVFSLFPELEGTGNLPLCRLSPKDAPDVDLVDYDLHDQWPNVDAYNPHVREFLTAVKKRLDSALTNAGPDVDRRKAMGDLLISLCELIEEGYELSLAGGPNIAPGLAAAVTAEWNAPR